MLSDKQQKLAYLLASFHILIVASSNYLVQFPLTVLGFKATWGAFSFPFVFLATDLTVRIFGAAMGRRIIFYAMFPALIASYFITVGFRHGEWLGWISLTEFNWFVARIALASFSAYVIGQIMDVIVFNRLRQNIQWWHAPLASAVIGNFIDTLAFFFIAFYKTSDVYLAENWMEIAAVDFVFKMLVNAIIFLPLYKMLLDMIIKRLKS